MSIIDRLQTLADSEGHSTQCAAHGEGLDCCIEKPKIVTQIENSFREEGYLKFPQDIKEAKLMNVNEVRMSGHEFYERLAKHLNTYDWTQDEKDSILQAAFEVAEGLDKEQN